MAEKLFTGLLWAVKVYKYFRVAEQHPHYFLSVTSSCLLLTCDSSFSLSWDQSTAILAGTELSSLHGRKGNCHVVNLASVKRTFAFQWFLLTKNRIEYLVLLGGITNTALAHSGCIAHILTYRFQWYL